MLTIDLVLEKAARDFGVPYIPFKELKATRDSLYDDALNGHVSLESFSSEHIRYLELCCKAFGDPSAVPASSVPSFVDRQFAGSTIHASHKDISDLARLFQLIVGGRVNPNMLLPGMRHGPGATADGFISVDKWLRTVNELDPSSELIDPLNRLPRILGSEVCKYFDVPKTAWSMRGICAEPIWLQFVQQGIGHIVNRKLSGFFSVRDGQERNRRFAVNEDCETLDLSAASDFITVDLLDLLRHDSEEPLPALPHLIDLMLTYRSTFCSLPNGELVNLRSVANMGNGFCFSLLTLVCVLVCCLAYERVYGVRFRSRHQALQSFQETFSVFGDDIVVRRDCCLMTRYLLELFGLKVNSSKSSYNGVFKETCGSFILSGQTVPNILRLRDLNVSMSSLSGLCLAQRRAHRSQRRRLCALLTDALLSSELAPWIAMTNEYSNYGDSLVLYGERKALPAVRKVWSRRFHRIALKVNRIDYDSRQIDAGDSVGSMYLWENRSSHITCEPVGGAKIVSTKLYPGAQDSME